MSTVAHMAALQTTKCYLISRYLGPARRAESVLSGPLIMRGRPFNEVQHECKNENGRDMPKSRPVSQLSLHEVDLEILL